MTYSNMQLFALHLKKFRLERGYTQKALAQKVNISAAYLCKLESGKYYCSFKVLYKLASILGVEIHEFFNRKVD